jgi:hypothetical protein
MIPERALLLVGSAKTDASSTSASLGAYLLAALERLGVATRALTVHRGLHRSDAALLNAIADTHLLIVSTPLYIDSFPALVIRSMESIAAARERGPTPPRCGFVLIVNCGFPEAAQCETAIAIARLFGRRARFDWLGALAMGQGGTIDGRPLDKLGGFVRSVRGALDAAAMALAAGGDVPAEAVARMARPLMPPRLYTLAGNIGWARRAMKNHVALRELRARPFS